MIGHCWHQQSQTHLDHDHHDHHDDDDNDDHHHHIIIIIMLIIITTTPPPSSSSSKLSLEEEEEAAAAAAEATVVVTAVVVIACLCFQCIYQNSMPPYISDLLHPYCPSRTLRSLDASLLTVPRFSLETFGKKSFSVFGPTVWNSLPRSLRKSQCFTTFKAKLKTHLFRTHLC